MSRAITMDTNLHSSGDIMPLLPVRNEDLWRIFKKAEASFWTTEDIDIHQDKTDWKNRLTKSDRINLFRFLAYFTISVQNIEDHLTESLLHEIRLREAKFFYARQLMMENTHFESASLLMNEFIGSHETMMRLFSEVSEEKTLQDQGEWLRELSNNSDVSHHLIAMMIAKRIFNAPLHAMFFWLKKNGLMPGLSFWNELINRDEKLHTDFSNSIYSGYLKKGLNEAQLISLLSQTVEITCSCVKSTALNPVLGLDPGDLITYIKWQADLLCETLKIPRIYNVVNPFDWLESLSLHQRALSSTYDTLKAGNIRVVPSSENHAFDLRDDSNRSE